MTKRKLWLIEFLNELGLEVVHYETQTSSKSHIKMTVVPAWSPDPKPQTLVVYIDPGYKINFKFSQYLDNSFKTETECTVASLLIDVAQRYCGSDVDIEWVPYQKCSKRRSQYTPKPKPDHCYLRLKCSHLPWRDADSDPIVRQFLRGFRLS